jgi:hypothetical protein
VRRLGPHWHKDTAGLMVSLYQCGPLMHRQAQGPVATCTDARSHKRAAINAVRSPLAHSQRIPHPARRALKISRTCATAWHVLIPRRLRASFTMVKCDPVTVCNRKFSMPRAEGETARTAVAGRRLAAGYADTRALSDMSARTVSARRAY